ncbi:MAG TPA: ATP-binding protein [Vicinamibacterales bacterium]|nr:ATP-binding protein [Vicinamibacterales bacterium]
MMSVNAAGLALLGIILFLVILLIIVLMRVVKVASGRGAAARRAAESRTESAMLSMALQEALTKLKQQERVSTARAEASERLSSQIVEGLTSGLVVVDRDGMVQSVNPAARRILDLERDGIGLPFREVLASAPAMSAVISEALRGASPILRRTIALGAGRPQHLGVTVSPITASDGSLQAAVCLFTDLTAVVRLEEQLRLKEALARLGELTAGLAHEFRNGLATIHGYGRLLDPQALPEQARTCVEGIRAETTALGEVVTNFLRFARPDQMTLAPVDLHAVIQRAIEDLTGAAAVTTVHGAFGTIEGDDVLLRQAFSNLLRNSLEACEGAGVQPRITIHGDVGATDVNISVVDNGPGFEPEALSKAFQPFATTKPAGTGLGLAIVQKVIVSHNGDITAANRRGGGAQFDIRLPVPQAL